MAASAFAHPQANAAWLHANMHHDPPFNRSPLSASTLQSQQPRRAARSPTRPSAIRANSGEAREESAKDNVGVLKTDFPSYRGYGSRPHKMGASRQRGESDLGRPTPRIQLQPVKRQAFTIVSEPATSAR